MKIGIIGAGASGMMAAIIAAQSGNEVFLIEKKDRIGKKILATGNGKCNFTNLQNSNSDYYSQKKSIYADYISQFSEKDVLHFFQERGMLVKNKEGYCYPRSEQASTVLDILRQGLTKKNITILTECYPRSVKCKNSGFEVELNDHRKLFFHRLILACGSFAGEKKQEKENGYFYAKELGHKIVPVVPALVQIRASGADFKAVAGVRCEALIHLFSGKEEITSERGELQLTDYGISGIPVFQLSRYVSKGILENKKLSVSIDLLPEISFAQWEKIIEDKWHTLDHGISAECFLLGFLNKKLNYMFLKQAGIKADTPLQKIPFTKMKQVCYHMKRWQFPLEDTKPFENAQVCAGGVSLDEITLHMESKIHPGLFFAGEMLDVDGRCGGYNLQWAWTSGYLAGKYASLQ